MGPLQMVASSLDSIEKLSVKEYEERKAWDSRGRIEYKNSAQDQYGMKH